MAGEKLVARRKGISSTTTTTNTANFIYLLMSFSRKKRSLLFLSYLHRFGIFYSLANGNGTWTLFAKSNYHGRIPFAILHSQIDLKINISWIIINDLCFPINVMQMRNFFIAQKTGTDSTPLTFFNDHYTPLLERYVRDVIFAINFICFGCNCRFNLFNRTKNLFCLRLGVGFFSNGDGIGAAHGAGEMLHRLNKMPYSPFTLSNYFSILLASFFFC